MKSLQAKKSGRAVKRQLEVKASSSNASILLQGRAESGGERATAFSLTEAEAANMGPSSSEGAAAAVEPGKDKKRTRADDAERRQARLIRSLAAEGA